MRMWQQKEVQKLLLNKTEQTIATKSNTNTPKVMAKQKVKEEKQPKKNGRPSKYSWELVQQICEEIATSCKSLKKVCKENDDLPDFKTVWNWLNDESKKEFLHLYTRAKESQADILADEIIEIADDGTNDTTTDENGNIVTNHDVLGRSKLRLDARKFIAAKLKPKKYGDKVDITSDNKAIQTVVYLPEQDK